MLYANGVSIVGAKATQLLLNEPGNYHDISKNQREVVFVFPHFFRRVRCKVAHPSSFFFLYSYL